MKRRRRSLRTPIALAGLAVTLAAASLAWPGAALPAPVAVCEAATVAPKGTTLVDYSPGCPEHHAAEGKKTVLFFRANWCGMCSEAAARIAEEAPAGPVDLAVIEVDFDDSQALRARYGVTVQHTFVQIDAAGNLIKKWIGSESLVEVYGELD